MANRARPFSVVLRGGRKEAARTKYLAFLSGAADRPSRIGQGKSRSKSIPLVIRPYAVNLPATIGALASATIDAIKQLQDFTEVKERVDLAAAAPDGSGLTLAQVVGTVNVIPISGITPARIIKRIWTTSAATVKISEITGLKYGYRKSTSYSVPFGRASATAGAADTISAAFAAMRGQIDTANGLTKAFLKDEIA